MTTESLNVSDFSLVAALAPEGWEVVFHTSYDGTRMALLFCEDEPERALCIYAAAMGV